MPPRFAYWTILIDNKPTAFRARDRQELLPTLTQLKRTNPNVEMKWFARGRLWDSPEAQRAMGRGPTYTGEKRNKDWRPGGEHKDPRARFDKEAQRKKRREMRAERDKLAAGPPREQKPWRDKPAGTPPPSDRPWQTKPTGPRAQRKPWQNKPAGSGGPPRGDRPWSNKPPRERKWNDRPKGDRPPGGDRRPWQGKPAGPPRDRQASGGGWQNKPAVGGNRPWQNKPPGDRQRKAFPPRGPQGGSPQGGERRRRRDDEPPDRDR